jgi:hypothetical protein
MRTGHSWNDAGRVQSNNSKRKLSQRHRLTEVHPCLYGEWLVTNYLIHGMVVHLFHLFICGTERIQSEGWLGEEHDNEGNGARSLIRARDISLL